MNFRSPPLPLLLGAIPAELAPLLRIAEITTRSREGCAGLCEVRLGDRRLRVGWTGVGPAHAAAAAGWIAERFPTSWVLLTGYAGGTSEGLPTGRLLAANEVRRQGAGALIPDPTLYARLLSALGKDLVVHKGAFETCERIIANPAEKAALGKNGVCAAEMETHAAAGRFEQAGIPWAALRVVLDPVGHSLAGIEELADEQGRARPLRILPALARNPLLVTRLTQLAFRKPLADRALTQALERIGRSLD